MTEPFAHLRGEITPQAENVAKVNGVVLDAAMTVTQTFVGSIWRSGEGAPSNDLGNADDFYLDTLTGDVYQRDDTEYTLIDNLTGPQGEPGEPGGGGGGGVSDHGALTGLTDDDHPQYQTVGDTVASFDPADLTFELTGTPTTAAITSSASTSPSLTFLDDPSDVGQQGRAWEIAYFSLNDLPLTVTTGFGSIDLPSGWTAVVRSIDLSGWAWAVIGIFPQNESRLTAWLDAGPGGASAFADLSDVDVTTDPPAVDDVVAWDGTKWTPATLFAGPSDETIAAAILAGQVFG